MEIGLNGLEEVFNEKICMIYGEYRQNWSGYTIVIGRKNIYRENLLLCVLLRRGVTAVYSP